MNRARFLALTLLVALSACTEERSEVVSPTLDVVAGDLVLEDNPTGVADGATAVDLFAAPEFSASAVDAVVNADPASLTPSLLTAVLQAGETVTETKLAHVPAAPPKGDVLFMFDLTGSMGGELNTLKTQAVNIMNAITTVITDVEFGLISHEDYPLFVDSRPDCNYAATYGIASYGDLAYRRDIGMTGTTGSVASAIGAMTLKNGYDGPESYSRALFESYAELTAAGADPDYGPIGWRTGAKKIVVGFNDYLPHDCHVDAIIGGTGVTGIDPGRDDTPGTPDDLEILPVLNDMAAADVTLINIHSSGNLYFNRIWDAYAAVTGGTNYAINPNGTFPSGTDPATEISALIANEVAMIDELTLGVCAGSEAYASWIQGLSPASYTELMLPADVSFDITVGPPMGTDPGVYNFEICAIGDGVEYGRQTVMIVVYDPTDGFVTGGGWIYSAAGNYVPDPALEGKATFGFVSKYKKGATTPDGNTEFQFHAAGMNFHSTAYDWLVITGSNYARFKGTGTINGDLAPNGEPYKFMIWAGDDDPDTFRIRIWWEDSLGVETVVYDNGMDQEIAGGSIVIHTK